MGGSLTHIGFELKKKYKKTKRERK